MLKCCTWAIGIFAFAAGCGRHRPLARAGHAPATTPDSAAVRSTAQPAPLPPARSGSRFEFPGGYYMPDPGAGYGDTQIKDLELDGTPDTAAGLNRYSAHILIGRYGTDDFNERFTCSDALVRADTLDVVCDSTSFGTITFRGSFNGVLRPGWDSTMDFSEISQHALANATITVQRAGQVLLSKRVALVYWEGE